MNKIDLSKFENGLKASLEKVVERLVLQDTGLWVVFEEREFELEGFPNEAFYTPKREYYDHAPGEIEKYLSNDFEHFIWIPKWIVEGPEKRFVFRFSHECQHYRQSMSNVYKSTNQDFRENLIVKGWRPSQLKVEKSWEEFDADREAYETFIDIYGSYEWDSFVEGESKDLKEKQHFIGLQGMLEKWKNWKSST